VRSVTEISTFVAEPTLHAVAGALLRRNMLARILERPGAKPLLASSGEAISRFRNDVDEVTGYLSWTLDPIGQVLTLGLGLGILARIDAAITLFTFVPLVLVIAVVNQMQHRVREYRRANQQAIGDVTGIL